MESSRRRIYSTKRPQKVIKTPQNGGIGEGQKRVTTHCKTIRVFMKGPKKVTPTVDRIFQICWKCGFLSVGSGNEQADGDVGDRLPCILEDLYSYNRTR